jgi:DNA polymerase I-like protein with 3'-5' exonuclease and polymerase domains
MTIQPKIKAVIQKGTTMSYHPDTFVCPENFIEATAEEILQNIKPLSFEGMRLISVDTETHAVELKNNEVPATLVRRWVGSGKTAKPQDFPFCISICDGINSYTLYDSLDNNFAEMKKLAPLLEDETIDKVLHNTKYDMHELANIGMKMKGRIHDTVVVSKLANENRNSFTLVNLAKEHGGITVYEDMVDLYKKTYKVVDYRQIPKPLLTAYANADVWNCLVVFQKEYPKLIEDELSNLYQTELVLMHALYDMERVGMLVDTAYREPLRIELQRLADEAEKSIYDEAGRIFNANSGKQLYEVLMSLGTDPGLISKTDKGNPCLDKKALESLAEKGVSVVQKILEFRKYEKLLTTYAIGIYEQRGADDRVHCSINQTEATTGRMSITKPARRAS